MDCAASGQKAIAAATSPARRRRRPHRPTRPVRCPTSTVRPPARPPERDDQPAQHHVVVRYPLRAVAADVLEALPLGADPEVAREEEATPEAPDDPDAVRIVAACEPAGADGIVDVEIHLPEGG